MKLRLIALVVAAACTDLPTRPIMSPTLSQASATSPYIITLQPNATLPVLPMRHVYHGALRGFAADLTPQALTALQRNPQVLRIEPDGKFQVSQGRTFSTVPWGLDRLDQRLLPMDGVFTPTGTGAGTHIYIIDSGIWTTHQDFGGRASMDGDFTGSNDGWSSSDCLGHGTHVTGIAGGATMGVARSARLHGLRVFNCAGEGEWSSLLAAIDYVVTSGQRPSVINLSLGGDSAPGAVNDAVEGAVAAGVSVIAAAGNDVADACTVSPASAPSAITVMASNRYDQRSGFSNYGPCTDLYAPGSQIKSTWTCDTCYVESAGTSMSAPHVSGAVALLLSATPMLTPAQITQQIVSNATQNIITYSMPNTPNHLLYIGTAPQPVPCTKPKCKP